MVLPLTRSLAAHQVRRTFTHQTWVSGDASLVIFYKFIPIPIPLVYCSTPPSLGPPRTRIAFAEKCAHGLLISAGVLTGGQPLHSLLSILSRSLACILRFNSVNITDLCQVYSPLYPLGAPLALLTFSSVSIKSMHSF